MDDITKLHDVMTGTCAVCLNRFVVTANEPFVPVLHGYKRPGNGAIRGNCDGMQFPAYEKSTAGCFWVRDNMLHAAASHRNHAGMLRTGQTLIVYATKDLYEGSRRKQVAVTLTPASTFEEFRAVHVHNWAELVQREERRHIRDAETLESQAAIYQAWIDAWKPGLEFVSEARLNAQAAEIREERARVAARKRLFKAAKAAFFHIGVAISKHRKGWTHADWEWEHYATIHGDAQRIAHYADVHRLAPFAETYPGTVNAKRKRS